MLERVFPWLAKPAWERAFAVIVFASVAWLFYYLTHVPVARALDPAAPWTAVAGDRLVLRPLGTATVLTVEGADNEGVDLRFDHAAIDPATAQALRRDFKLVLPAASGPIAWTTRVKSSGHTSIEVALKPEGPSPALRLAQVGAGSHPGIAMQAADASLYVQFSVALGGAGEVEAPEQKTLRIGATAPIELPGAVPLAVIVPAGKRFTLSFPVERPASLLRIGELAEGESGGGLPLRDAGLLRGETFYRLYACAAGVDQRFLRPRRIRASDCSDRGELRALALTLTSNSLSLVLQGSGFMAKEGVAQSDDWLEKLQKNPAVATLFGMTFAALGKWLWSVFARPMPERATR